MVQITRSHPQNGISYTGETTTVYWIQLVTIIARSLACILGWVGGLRAPISAGTLSVVWKGVEIGGHLRCQC